jgi:hypothetical protein
MDVGCMVNAPPPSAEARLPPVGLHGGRSGQFIGYQDDRARAQVDPLEELDAGSRHALVIPIWGAIRRVRDSTLKLLERGNFPHLGRRKHEIKNSKIFLDVFGM